MILSYSKVFAIGHRRIQEIFNGDVIIQEKVDGSQFSFGKVNGELFCRSRGKGQMKETDKMFLLAVEMIEKVKDKLVDGYIYRGEYLSKPKHNTIEYERTPMNYIVLFDIDRTGMTDYMPWKEAADHAKEIGFEFVPTIYFGPVNNFEDFHKFLDRDSFLGGAKIEGIVVKNYSRWTDDGKTMMGKFVSEAFKEKHSKDWKERNPAQKDVVSKIISKLGSEARWEKAVQHLTEKSQILGEPQDIAGLFKEVHADFEEECIDEVKDMLWDKFKRDILRGVCRGLPEWYKEKLAKSAFGDFSDLDITDSDVEQFDPCLGASPEQLRGEV